MTLGEVRISVGDNYGCKKANKSLALTAFLIVFRFFMCGIAGIVSKDNKRLSAIESATDAMGRLLRHRGPDEHGSWTHEDGNVAFNHQRLSVIDLEHGHQPMTLESGNWIVFNGEIYNYKALRFELGAGNFTTHSDTEVILRAYEKWGESCVERLRGMFAFAIWDEKRRCLFCARDRFGIKPFYFAQTANAVLFASEVKALLPFLDGIETDHGALRDYLTFQFCLPGSTLFRGVQELPPAHQMVCREGKLTIDRYWEVHYEPDFCHTEHSFNTELEALLESSIDAHLVSDVPVGAYVSGGIDSSLIASLGNSNGREILAGFNGRFKLGSEYDESEYARLVSEKSGFPLHVRDISAEDFAANIEKVIYHLDYPVAGPGSFSQFMVSGLAAQHCKVVLGGQGGDEIFGGYARYLIAYFEQCIRSAIDGTMHDGNFIVTYESIIPNLCSLRNYKSMLQDFWSEGIFEEMDRRYFKLIDKSANMRSAIAWEALPEWEPFARFREIFYAGNVGKTSYFDLMTHFDFKTLLPALLHVEDRMSMAHGLEARVPLLDHPLVERAATMPADVKFRNGELKQMLKSVARPYLPSEVTDRKDKMGFPTPLNQWAQGPAREFVSDLLSSERAQSRGFIDNGKVLDCLSSEGKFGRSLWGALSLEIWQTQFHDKAVDFAKIGKETGFES